MKKQKFKLSIFFGMFAMVAIAGFCRAESIQDSENRELTREDVGMFLQNVSMSFCNEGVDNPSKILNQVVSEGTTFDACLLFTNNTDYDVVLNLDFSDAGVDKEYGVDLCLTSQGFRQYVVNADEISQITVPAHNYLVKEAQILFPIGVDKNQAGCFSFWIDGEQNIGGGNGGISIAPISRQGRTVKFYVGSLDEITNKLEVSNVKSRLNEEGQLILTFDVNNVGNLENKIAVNGSISNIFGYKKTYTSDQIGIDANVVPGRGTSVEVNMGYIPNYGGLYNIEFEVTGTPYFSYQLSDDFDQNLLNPITAVAHTNYFEMPWMICLIVVIIIILIILLFRRPKNQVVYVQAPNN